MKITVAKAWIITLLCFVSGILWPLGLIGICVSSYITIKSLIHEAINYSKQIDTEQINQQEIERKEIDMVRKSNEILLHLIQDEHREEGDR